MDDDIDALLHGPLLAVPEDFTGRVMRRIGPARRPVARPSLLERLQQLALIGAGIAGASQFASFLFGAWRFAAVG